MRNKYSASQQWLNMYISAEKFWENIHHWNRNSPEGKQWHWKKCTCSEWGGRAGWSYEGGITKLYVSIVPCLLGWGGGSCVCISGKRGYTQSIESIDYWIRQYCHNSQYQPIPWDGTEQLLLSCSSLFQLVFGYNFIVLLKGGFWTKLVINVQLLTLHASLHLYLVDPVKF